LGQLARLLIIFGAIWLAVLLLKRALRPKQTRQSDSTDSALPRMVPCAHCGVHVPESETVLRAGKFFCSDEHRIREEAKR